MSDGLRAARARRSEVARPRPRAGDAKLRYAWRSIALSKSGSATGLIR